MRQEPCSGPAAPLATSLAPRLTGRAAWARPLQWRAPRAAAPLGWPPLPPSRRSAGAPVWTGGADGTSRSSRVHVRQEKLGRQQHHLTPFRPIPPLNPPPDSKPPPLAPPSTLDRPAPPHPAPHLCQAQLRQGGAGEAGHVGLQQRRRQGHDARTGGDVGYGRQGAARGGRGRKGVPGASRGGGSSEGWSSRGGGGGPSRWAARVGVTGGPPTRPPAEAPRVTTSSPPPPAPHRPTPSPPLHCTALTGARLRVLLVGNPNLSLLR